MQGQSPLIAIMQRFLIGPHRFGGTLPCPYQGEVCGTPTDIADQNGLPAGNDLLPILRVQIQPGIEGCLGLFDQNDPRQTG